MLFLNQRCGFLISAGKELLSELTTSSSEFLWSTGLPTNLSSLALWGARASDRRRRNKKWRNFSRWHCKLVLKGATNRWVLWSGYGVRRGFVLHLQEDRLGLSNFQSKGSEKQMFLRKYALEDEKRLGIRFLLLTRRNYRLEDVYLSLPFLGCWYDGKKGKETAGDKLLIRHRCQDFSIALRAFLHELHLPIRIIGQWHTCCFCIYLVSGQRCIRTFI